MYIPFPVVKYVLHYMAERRNLSIKGRILYVRPLLKSMCTAAAVRITNVLFPLAGGCAAAFVFPPQTAKGSAVPPW